MRKQYCAARTARHQQADEFVAFVVCLACAAAAGLLFAGGVFQFTRRVPQRRHKHVIDRHGIRAPVGIRSPIAAKRPPTDTDPANDLKRSLLEHKRDLKSASEAIHRPLRVAVFSVSAAAPSSLSGLRKAGYLKAGGRTLSHSQGRLILCTTRAPRHAGLA